MLTTTALLGGRTRKCVAAENNFESTNKYLNIARQEVWFLLRYEIDFFRGLKVEAAIWRTGSANRGANPTHSVWGSLVPK